MSVRVMSDVWASDLPPRQKLVLLAYADHANDHGESIFPGEDRMVEKTSYSAGNIRKITNQLIKANILERVKSGHRGQRAEFRIDLLVLGAHIARHTGVLGAHIDAERRAYEAAKARTGDTPNVMNHQEPRDGDAQLVDISDGIPHHYCLNARGFVDVPISDCDCKPTLGTTRKERHA